MLPPNFHNRSGDDGASAPLSSTGGKAARGVGVHSVRAGPYILLCHVKLEDPMGWMQVRRIEYGRYANEDIFIRCPDPCEGCEQHHWIYQGVTDPTGRLHRSHVSEVMGLPDQIEEAMEHCYEKACADLEKKVKTHGVPEGTAPNTIPEDWL